MKLSDIDLTPGEAHALRRWLGELDKHYQTEDAIRDDEQARDEQESTWHEKLTAIAVGYAERHGLLENMDAWEQAKAACASWEAQAGYLDVDEHFQMDDDWRETWLLAYTNRLGDLRRAK